MAIETWWHKRGEDPSASVIQAQASLDQINVYLDTLVSGSGTGPWSLEATQLQVLAKLGEEGVVPPASLLYGEGSGVIGWLRNQWELINGAMTMVGAQNALRVAIVSGGGGGGGGGGDATAANQVLQLTELTAILNKLIAAPSTEAKQDAAIALLTAINTALGNPLTINLPTGISTEAKQDAIITALGLLSTAAGQTTGNTTLASILAALSGTLAVSAASLPLPTGASTAANQTTGNNYLYSIDQWLQALHDAQRQQGQTVGSAQTWLSAARQRATPSDEATEGTVAWLQMSGGRLYTRTILDAAVPAGANVIGKVSIDQTTPGTTNAVEVIQVPAITKGTQGSRGLTVQPLRDAGRVSVVYRPSHGIGAYSGFSSDTAYVATMYKALGSGSVSASGTSFVIPAGKIFRVQTFRAMMMVQMTSPVATRVQVGLLIDPSGTITNASPLAMTIRLTGQATAGFSSYDDITIPEGFDIVGDGTLAIGVYLLANFSSGAGPAVQFNLIGYEF